MLIAGVPLLCAVLFAAQVLAAPAAFPPGRSARVIEAGGEAIEIHAYKPAAYRGGPLLVSLHGLAGNAPGYRDHAIPLADRMGLLVIAPHFDRKRFPRWRYQAGGLVRRLNETGELTVEPPERWTGRLLLDLIAAVRAAENAPGLPYSLIGHSGGAQMLSRLAAFVPHEARRIVIANPSTYLWPARGERFPYGFDGLPARLSNDDALRRYLAQPVTLLLGTADTRRDDNLNLSEGAERQGATRHERGINAFRAARETAQANGWPFHWRLVEVPGVGHSARRMFASPQAAAALAGD